MKTKKWLGLATALSPYDAPSGTAQEQNNLQVLLPGQAKPRDGMEYVCGEANYVAYSVYAKPNGINVADTLLVHASQGGQRSIYEVATNSTYTLKQVLSDSAADYRPTFAEDRHGNVYVFYGYSVKPRKYRTTLNQAGQSISEVVDLGLPAPTTAPTLTLDGTGVFVERVDVLNSGGAYTDAPPVSFSMGAGGTFYREAKARAVLEAGRVVSIEVTDGGSNYTQQPQVVIGGSIGSGFTGKAYVTQSPQIWGVSNTINYTYNSGTAAWEELSTPQAYTPSLTNYAGGTPAPTLGAGETYGSISFLSNSPSITVASAVATLSVTASALGSITVAGDQTAYNNYRISYPSGAANLYVHSGTHNSGANTTTFSVGNGPNLSIATSTAVTFWSTQDISLLSQPSALTFTATVPLVASNDGNGATALITFLDQSVQYTTPQPTAVIADTFDRSVVGGVPTYMTSTACSGDTRGLQGSPLSRVRGWAGNNSLEQRYDGYDYGTMVTVYWSDYSRIGYFVNTGTIAVPIWTQRSAPLQAATVTVNGQQLTYAYADITLEPTGDIAQASNAVHPTYRMKFAYCMVSGTYRWDRTWTIPYRVGGNDCGTDYYQCGYATRNWSWNWLSGWQSTTVSNPAPNGSTWWGSIIPQPVVDFWKDANSTNYTDHYGLDFSSSIVKQASGSNISQNTKYQFRLYQANANHEVVTSDAGANGAWARDFGGSNTSLIGTYLQIDFNATQVATEPATAPPAAIVGTPTLNNTGSGWVVNETGYVQLLSRPLSGSTIADYSFGPKYTWTTVLTQNQASSDFITSVAITSQGSNYLTPPTILTRTTQGYGLVLEPELTDGRVTKINIIDGGGGFSANDQPSLYTSDQRAEAIAVMRPAMQGVYRCAYRYADTSATRVGTASISLTQGSTAATVTYAGELPLAGLVVRGTGLPHMTRIQSAVQSGLSYNVTLTAPATATNASTAVELRDYTKPITYSNFSPIVDVDCGPNASRSRTSRINWTVDGTAPPRADTVELFRTSGDQSLVFYRLEMYGEVYGGNVVLNGEDTLNDEELFDSSRPFYAAVPVVLPNGSLNAYRFGTPRVDCASACAFADRLWYAGSTSGKDVNTVFFSEYDEFESCPPENSLSIQNNHKTNDSITALVPFGGVLLIMQRTHCHQLTYNTDPNVDAAIQLIANRGLANPQCYDVHNNVLYGLDEKGVYAMTLSGDIEPISEPIADMFVYSKIDFTKSNAFFVKVDSQRRVLRAFVCDETAQDDRHYPSLVLCYHLDYKVWWTESHANGFLSATNTARAATQTLTPVYASVDGKVYSFSGNVDQPFRSITGGVTVVSNATFTEVPTLVARTFIPDVDNIGVTISRGTGARFMPIMKGGKISEIVVLARGFGYGYGEGADFEQRVDIITEDGTKVGECNALLPTNTTTRISVPWWVKTNNYELINDENARGGDGLMDRSVLVTYAPTKSDSFLYARQFFNNSKSPRENVMPRNRGTGFLHETEGARATLNMKSLRSPLAEATGVSKAVFAGRAAGDMAGSDRHIAVGLYAEPDEVNSGSVASVSPATLYGLEMRGVLDGQ